MNNQTPHQKWIIKRLDRLVKLVRSNEPDKPSNESLFGFDHIEALTLHTTIAESYDNLAQSEVRDIMIKANSLWKWHKKIYNGEVDNSEQARLIHEIEGLIIKGQKISAIKHHRKHAEAVFGKEASLKESKQYCDTIQDHLIKTGVISV